MADQNPFTPGQPASIDLFVGREDEVKKLVAHVEQATAGKLQVAFLTGERGIGKSSLAAYVRYYAETTHNMAAAHVFLGGVHDLNEMTRRIFDKLLKESIERKWFDTVKDLFGRNIDKVGLFGLNVQFKPSAEELDALTRGFPTAMRNLTDKLRTDKKQGRTGVFLILDDIDALADEQAFADWLKSTLDEIAVIRDAVPLCVLLVGLEERRQKMIEKNPSLARTFHVFPIAPWSLDETKRFLSDTLAGAGVTCEAAALDVLSTFAGGLPVLAHEIGEAAYNRVKEGKIVHAEAIGAVIDAAQVVGVKHLKPQVLQAIQSATYLNTLDKVSMKADMSPATFTKSMILPLLDDKEQGNFHNFLQRMVKLGVLKHTATPGEYQFATLLHHLYLRMEAVFRSRVREKARSTAEGGASDDKPSTAEGGDDKSQN